jgi:hypothetical protein
MDLGLVNEAEHWAYEAVEIKGYTARNLARLGEVHLLKGQTAIASKYLAMLRATPWHRRLADRYGRYLADANLVAEDPYLGQVLKAMPQEDFLVAPEYPEFCLLELVKDPNNTMAFEYYMAQCLLEGDLKGLVRYLPRLEQPKYTRIPRHLEEAIMIWMQLPGAKLPLDARRISDQTIRRFNDFTKVLMDLHGDRHAAARQLARYWDTYWFYWQYVVSGGRS